MFLKYIPKKKNKCKIFSCDILGIYHEHLFSKSDKVSE